MDLLYECHKQQKVVTFTRCLISIKTAESLVQGIVSFNGPLEIDLPVRSQMTSLADFSLEYCVRGTPAEFSVGYWVLLVVL